MLEPSLLLLLHRGKAHGYTLLERLEEFGRGVLNPSVVYRALRDMEERDLVTSTWDEEETRGPPRRVYQITTQGDEALQLWVQELQEARGRIERLLDAYDEHMAEDEGEHH
jgi:DNA-binding PadR family transcriptional regulator